jgi:hypothetical protein
LIYKKPQVYNSWYIANMAPIYISQEISQNKTYIWQGVITGEPLSFKLQTTEMTYNHQIKCIVHFTHFTLYFAEKKNKQKNKKKTKKLNLPLLLLLKRVAHFHEYVYVYVTSKWYVHSICDQMLKRWQIST